MNFPPIFSFFLFWRETQNSKSEKNMDKQADHGLTVRLPVAIKKGGHYSPYAFLSLTNTTRAKITLISPTLRHRPPRALCRSVEKKY
jgi:hypothetical protein